jgi:trimeric autotransporter adhesin
MSTTKIPNELLSSGVGTGASNLVELDSSGKLPAVDGSNLTGVAQSHTSSGTAPSSPSIGDKWHDTTNEKLYMRTNDGTSNLWLQI